MAILLDGRALAAVIREKMKQRIAILPSQPGLAVILVGTDPASHTYVTIKQKACEELGIRFEKFVYPANESEESILRQIQILNTRKDIHGILVQLPLPNQDTDRLIQAIDPKKDVDGFHPENIARLKQGAIAIAPAVALGIMKLIDLAVKNVHGLRAVIVSSPLFAEPLVALLNERRITVDVFQEESTELNVKTCCADILIVAEGHPALITGDMVKPGAIVIDVGTTKRNKKLLGDVDQESVEPVAGFLTPVPGGVGPMTVAMLMVNVLKAYSLQNPK